MNRSQRRWVPLIVVFACDGSAYLLLMARLGMTAAGGVVVLACLLRAVFLPTGRILIAQLPRSKSARLVLSLALSAAVYLGILVHLVYAGYFRTVPHFKALHHLDDLPATVSQVVLQLVDLPVLIVMILFVVQAVVLPRLLKEWRPAPGRAAVALLALLSLFVANRGAARMLYERRGAVPAERLAVYGLPDAVLRFGFGDLWWTQLRSEINHLRWLNPAAAYPGKTSEDAAPVDEVRPLGLNLIMVQMESVEQWAIDAEVRERPVMPFLQKLQSEALVFKHVFAHHSGGGSSDAELASLLSLLPLATHSGLLTADWDRVNPLPRHLAAHGYLTVAMHANRATYFNRDLAYPEMGFDTFLSSADYGGAARGWSSRDEAFLTQSLEKMRTLPEPFFALVITMQSHGPFTNHDRRPAADPGPGHDRLERDYLQCMAEVDGALELFVAGLEALGLLHRSVVMLYGDHSAQVADHRVADKEVVPLMVLAPGRESSAIDRVGSHLDLAPTALDLLGLSEPEGWIGSSLLAPGQGVALFNDLSEIRLEEGRLVSMQAEGRLPYLLYSASILDP